jgi:5-formyltetrahydrofolate cyclo-ligase
VPGLAFDRKLFRLGRGRGFYDRALANTSGLKIGLASVQQISNTDIDSEEHDCPMDVVVTEKYVLKRFRAS